MLEARTTSIPLGAQHKLSVTLCLESDEERNYVRKICYTSAIRKSNVCYDMPQTWFISCSHPVSSYMSDPKKENWSAVKSILKYIKGSINVGLIYGKGSTKETTIMRYVDQDYVSDLEERISQTSYVFTVLGNTMSWKATLQYVVALLTLHVIVIAKVIFTYPKFECFMRGLNTDLPATFYQRLQ